MSLRRQAEAALRQPRDPGGCRPAHTDGVTLIDAIRGSNRAGANDVAADSDALILVDEADREVGPSARTLCHEGQGVSASRVFAAGFQ